MVSLNSVLVAEDDQVKATNWRPMDGGNDGAWGFKPYVYCFITLQTTLANFSQPKALVPSENYRVIIATKIHANKTIRLLERNKEHVRKKREHKKEPCTAFRGRCYSE